jgi:deoxyribonuclease-1
MRLHHHLLFISTVVTLCVTVEAGAYFEIEEFDEDTGAWTMSPQKIGRSDTLGWQRITNDGEQSVKASPTGTRYTYYWKLTRDLDLTQAVEPQLELKYHYKGHTYEYFQVQIGPEGSTRNSQFTTLLEATDASDDPETVYIDLADWVGQRVVVRLVLKKPYNVVENKIGLYVHRVGVVTTYEEEPPPPEPNLVAVGAFNCQVFGKTKMSKENVPGVILDTIERYDLMAFQEIRDASGDSIATLYADLDAQSGGAYEMLLSDRLGRTSSKEQYAFFYKPEKLTLMDSYHYDDGVEPDDDQFQREPFIARFGETDGDVDFAVIVIHTSPSDAVEEVGLLHDVVLDVEATWGEQDVVVLGDFNASCNYVDEDDFLSIPLRTDPGYTWWIPDDVDTTVTTTTCAYDRIVTAGEISTLVVPDSAGVFFYDQAYVLDEDLARAVSDHYPVEFTIDLNFSD